MQTVELYGLTVNFDDESDSHIAYMELKAKLERCLNGLNKELSLYPAKIICHYVLLQVPMYFTVIVDNTIHIGIYNNDTKEICQSCSYSDLKGLSAEKVNQLSFRLTNMLRSQREINPGTEIHRAWQACLEQKRLLERDGVEYDDYEL